MPISDEEATKLLREELERFNTARKADWPLEPIHIEKQSSHFWEISSNFGTSDESIKLLIDVQKGKVLKNSHRVRYDKDGIMHIHASPS